MIDIEAHTLNQDPSLTLSHSQKEVDQVDSNDF